ncbi:MAG: c-type cytochrome [Anaerolineae bacterium]
MFFPTRIARRGSAFAAIAIAALALALSSCGTPATPFALPATPTSATRVPTDAPTGEAEQPQVEEATAAAPTNTVIVPPTTAPTVVAVAPTATTRSCATATPKVTPIPGDPAVGEQYFANGFGADSIAPACSTCHNVVDDGTVKAGPLMAGLMQHAAHHAMEAKQDVYTYLHTSIVNPNAYLVPNEPGKVFSANGTSVMYQNYAQDLTEAQITDLIAYLMTLQ